ncbi:MAG: transglutaminase-like domain-containing protein [Desulfarculaceae bacterium]|nr:transglutaminase-like domain-containing protein [Desulfarculaceae bacterium]MCF8048513.1 transglutaminase-like domain-containing protein [Desulfarculaceae bacterium]MCF8065921.1 transglutaminase-like domain-containing protein [Desulfarculaceae bacterium]MCF8097529.1 transglutaminase-like domain-containing protein [Desulfarculaceae bacterium]MCF8122224.1 transglutaminase-like domain-containing protein [Desulfarculaceae bacterium]
MSDEQPLENFLVPAPGVQCEAAEIFELARRTARGSVGDVEAARRLFEFVRDTVRYSVRVPFDSLEHYLALNTLARGRGYCVQKAALLCALARAVGIPSRLGFADIENNLLPEGLYEITGGKVLSYHCFVEWYVGGAWYKATPSFDKALSAEHGWRLVEFVPGEDLLLPATDLAGRPHIRYLQQRGWRLGVPLEEMMAYWTEDVGLDHLDAWRAWAQAAEAAS